MTARLTALPAPFPTLLTVALVAGIAYWSYVLFVRMPREERDAENRRRALGNRGVAR